MSFPESGSPQGGVVSPLLSHVLHEVLDVWFEQEVKPRLRGRAFLIRYADDFVLAFTHEEDARRVLAVLPKRFGKYGLALHPDKTRLIELSILLRQMGRTFLEHRPGGGVAAEARLSSRGPDLPCLPGPPGKPSGGALVALSPGGTVSEALRELRRDRSRPLLELLEGVPGHPAEMQRVQRHGPYNNHRRLPRPGRQLDRDRAR